MRQEILRPLESALHNANDALYSLAAIHHPDVANECAEIIDLLLKAAVGFGAMGACAFDFSPDRLRALFDHRRDEINGQIADCRNFGAKVQ